MRRLAVVAVVAVVAALLLTGCGKNETPRPDTATTSTTTSTTYKPYNPYDRYDTNDASDTNGTGAATGLAFLFAFPFIMAFLIWLATAVVAGLIAANRNRSGWGFFFATFFFLGPLGIMTALLATRGELDGPPEGRKLAHGRRRFTCPRCSAVNDIPEADVSYECWRCGEVRKVQKAPT